MRRAIFCCRVVSIYKNKEVDEMGMGAEAADSGQGGGGLCQPGAVGGVAQVRGEGEAYPLVVCCTPGTRSAFAAAACGLLLR